MGIVLGIDEAGRGPVIGPLVICGALCEETNLKKLKEIGVKDSKILTPQQRENLNPLIKNIIKDFKLIKILPALLDRENLNELEIKATASLIKKFSPQKVILDTPVPRKGIKGYLEKIKKLVPNNEVKIIGEPHADATYPIVSAASILAKVSRDKEIHKLHKKYGDFGSGYPADPKTQEFIKNWNFYPEIVRRKWETCKEILVGAVHEPPLHTLKIIVIGDVDTGKTEFCKYLINSGLKKGYRVGVLDLDIGQSHIGPPGSLGFGIATKRIRKLSSIRATIIHPMNALSPAGISERILIGLKSLLTKIPEDIDLLVIDTTGYIRTEEALKLKIQKIKLINPDRIVLIEHTKELDKLTKELDLSKVYKFPVDSKTRRKSIEERAKFREKSALKYLTHELTLMDTKNTNFKFLHF